MSGSKSRASNTQNFPVTRGVSATVASKLAKMAAASSDDSSTPDPVKDSPDILSTSQLVSELEKQRASLLKDMSTLIRESVGPLQTSVDALRETVSHFNGRLAAAESLAGDNFERITITERAVKTLQAQNKSLQDRLDDLENRSRRVNLRIINVPEGSEKGRNPTEFVSELLMKNLGPEVLPKPPELERAHRSLAPNPGPGGRPRPFVICFHRFQEREKVLRWARQHELKHRDTTLRVYPDVSANTAKKRAGFNKIKQALYQKGVKFRLLFPARLQVSYEGETFTFETPEDAQAFYNERLMNKE
uniref:L1 transposable element RRM domain-containing protein n=1 Tax=Sander lucioperca TaxID=283035 RepID=A0A8D0A8L6_SANLU